MVCIYVSKYGLAKPPLKLRMDEQLQPTWGTGCDYTSKPQFQLIWSYDIVHF